MSDEPTENNAQDEALLPFKRAFFQDAFMELATIREGEDRNDPERLAKFAATCLGSATVEFECGAFDTAERQCLAAVRIWEELIRDRRGSGDYRRECASAYNNLGLLKMQGSDFAGAAGWFQNAVRLLEELVREQPASHVHLHELGGSINDLGLAQEQLGQIGQARKQFNRSLEIRAALAREHPSVAEYDASHVKSQMNLENFNANLGRLRFIRRVGASLIAVSVFLTGTWLWLGGHGWLVVFAVTVFLIGAVAYLFGFVKDDPDEGYMESSDQ